jgi:hypothetical protein
LELGLRVSDSFQRAERFWIADAHRDDGKRFAVRADEKLTAFIGLESAVRKNSIDIFCRRLAESRSR